MKEKQPLVELVTIKVTKDAAKNFKIAAALAGLNQYEVSEEGSHFVHGKYLTKTNRKQSSKK